MHDHAIVLGLGESGMAAAELLLEQGSAVTVLDGGEDAAVRKRAAALCEAGAEILLGQAHLPERPFDLAVVSPGVPSSSAWVRALRQSGTPVIGELELGWRHRRSRVLAVTGSNGKSTIVKWLSETLEQAGLPARPAGNYGLPLSRAVRMDPPPDWLVVEVSSFQLETVEQFAPEVAILLNLFPNHLDRHRDMDEYRELKLRVFNHLADPGARILPCHMAKDAGGRWTTFGCGREADFQYEDGRIRGPNGLTVDLRSSMLGNAVLGPNAAAAVAALSACGVEPRYAELSARGFRGLAHRLEKVATVAGIDYIDDSKATNLAALEAAVRSLAPGIRLIAGGLAKESIAPSLKEVLAQKVTATYLIGAAAEQMQQAWSDRVPSHLCGELERAFERACGDARAGETVLLAPGCASFDQFSGYQERGERFSKLVRALVQEDDTCAGRHNDMQGLK